MDGFVKIEGNVMLSDPCPHEDQVSALHKFRAVPAGYVPSPKAPVRMYMACKTVAEWFLALFLASLTLPLIAALAVAVKLTSPGPVFYTQTRLGRFRREFRIIKLRTMYHDCEASTGAVWSSPGDARVTPLGRLLRDTHMDELPQLFNVIMGHMALVGPRPERPEITAKIERILPEFGNRLLVRPGVTGLAQMRLPADTDLEGVRRKLAHDLYYVRHVRPTLDARIAFSTAFYFFGAASQALCAALVRSDGRAVETGVYAELPVPLRDECEIGVA